MSLCSELAHLVLLSFGFSLWLLDQSEQAGCLSLVPCSADPRQVAQLMQIMELSQSKDRPFNERGF